MDRRGSVAVDSTGLVAAGSGFGGSGGFGLPVVGSDTALGAGSGFGSAGGFGSQSSGVPAGTGLGFGIAGSWRTDVGSGTDAGSVPASGTLAAVSAVSGTVGTGPPVDFGIGPPADFGTEVLVDCGTELLAGSGNGLLVGSGIELLVDSGTGTASGSPGSLPAGRGSDVWGTVADGRLGNYGLPGGYGFGPEGSAQLRPCSLQEVPSGGAPRVPR